MAKEYTESAETGPTEAEKMTRGVCPPLKKESRPGICHEQLAQ